MKSGTVAKNRSGKIPGVKFAIYRRQPLFRFLPFPRSLRRLFIETTNITRVLLNGTERRCSIIKRKSSRSFFFAIDRYNLCPGESQTRIDIIRL